MNEPALVLADEPTGNLDRDSANQVFELLTEIQRETGTTFLLSTHDESLASRCERRIRLQNGVITSGNEADRAPPRGHEILTAIGRIVARAPS
ncbi:MAG: hypothetical protein R3E72_06655 [Steroidobacteraceae bacterium]